MAIPNADQLRIAGRRPTSGWHQLVIIATTMPFAVILPPMAAFVLAGLVLLEWDLRRDPIWWCLVLAAFFLPWFYIVVALIFVALGGTRRRGRWVYVD